MKNKSALIFKHGLREYLRMARQAAIIRRSGMIDKEWYLERNGDVREARVGPIQHYLWHGASEARDPNPLFDTDWYLKQNIEIGQPKAGLFHVYVRMSQVAA